MPSLVLWIVSRTLFFLAIDHLIPSPFFPLGNTTINHLLPEISDLETEEIKVFHWHIEDWRALEPRCHGPEFTVGGFPW